MTEQTEIFELEKSIWTHDDFEEMSWHDSNIYGLTIERNEDNFTTDFLLDIDYIFKWVHPIPPTQTFIKIEKKRNLIKYSAANSYYNGFEQ